MFLGIFALKRKTFVLKQRHPVIDAVGIVRSTIATSYVVFET